MKTNSILTVVTLGLMMSLPALADWSAPVTYGEAIFGCNGTTPSFTKGLGVNVATSHGEVRLPEGAIAVLSQSELALVTGQSNTLFGTLADQPTCTVEDAGEAATPSWNKINFAAGANVVLNFKANFASCAADAIGTDGFSRNNTYTLTVTKNGAVSTAQWTEAEHYVSEASCKNTNL